MPNPSMHTLFEHPPAKGSCKHPSLTVAWLALTLTFLGILPQVQATTSDSLDSGSVEIPFWERDFSGSIGGNKIHAELTRVGRKVSGGYCYQRYPSCKKSQFYLLQLNGEVEADGSIDLTETNPDDKKSPSKETGGWVLRMQEHGVSAKGTWQSSEGSRKLSIRLAQNNKRVRPFPYEIRLVASGQADNDDSCSDDQTVTAIRLYDKEKLVQELPTDSHGYCSIFTPGLVDANFDGWPDLTLQLSQGAGPNSATQYWLYNPATRKFDNAPQTLQDIASASFDTANKVVFQTWRSDAATHGVTTFRWKGGKLVKTDEESTYWLPVLDSGKQLYCGVDPQYDNGHIIFQSKLESWPDGSLRLNFTDLKSCDSDNFIEAQESSLDIWHRDTSANRWKILRSEKPRWQKVHTIKGVRYCLNVPFFDTADKQIHRIVLVRNDPDMCTSSKPG